MTDFKVGAPLIFPREMTPWLDDILGTMIMTTAPIAHLFRETGEQIPPKTEREHAFVLFWLLRIALEHGADWRKVAGAELKARVLRAKVQRSALLFPEGRPALTSADMSLLRAIAVAPQAIAPEDMTDEDRSLTMHKLAERFREEASGAGMLRITPLGKGFLETNIEV